MSAWRFAYPATRHDPAPLVDLATRVAREHVSPGALRGFFKALHVLHSEALADEWIRLPNTNRIFNGQAPLAYMLRGGLPAMQTVRQLLDARRASR